MGELIPQADHVVGDSPDLSLKDQPMTSVIGCGAACPNVSVSP